MQTWSRRKELGKKRGACVSCWWYKPREGRKTCKRCSKYAKVKAKRKTPEQRYLRNLKSDLKKHYNLTLEEYQAMLDEQNQVCAICKEPCRRHPRLGVDHDHESNLIRGLLCANCNVGIGHLRHSETLLLEAIKYLGNFRSKRIATQKNA